MDHESQPRILIVDDEEMILGSLRSFFALESDYDIVTHSLPEEAAN